MISDRRLGYSYMLAKAFTIDKVSFFCYWDRKCPVCYPIDGARSATDIGHRIYRTKRTSEFTRNPAIRCPGKSQNMACSLCWALMT